jgi:tRNA pseudouridine55 synthase
MDTMLPCGILNLNKSAGMTSRQVVDVVQRWARPARVGHAGTLDPLATGVLVVCVGAATRLIEYVQRMPKRYVGTFLLGRQSATEDIEGDVTELPSPPIPTREQIEAAAGRFVGRIAQRPPVFSALKVEGRRAYQLARKGQTPLLAARPVDIFRIEIVSYQYPELILDVECGGGTYIRSLGRDLAESMGTAAVMSALTRTSIGAFRMAEALDPRELNRDNWLQSLRPSLAAVEYLPRVQLTADEVLRIQNGLTVEWKGEGGRERGEVQPLAASPVESSLPRENAGISEIVAVDLAGQLVGILTPDATGQLRVLRNMPTVASLS